MKRYFNERTLQVLLCALLFAIGLVTWYFTHNALLSMLACMVFTALWIGIGFIAARPKNNGQGSA